VDIEALFHSGNIVAYEQNVAPQTPRINQHDCQKKKTILLWHFGAWLP